MIGNVQFTHNFIPSMDGHLRLDDSDPNKPFYLERINANVNGFCRVLFEEIKKIAQEDRKSELPRFKANPNIKSVYAPESVVAGIIKAFAEFRITLTSLQSSSDGSDSHRLFFHYLRNGGPAVYFTASWAYNNPYLFPPEIAPFSYTMEQHIQVLWQEALKKEAGVVFKVGDHRFGAHRDLVSAFSPPLKALFTGFREAQHQGEIELQGDKPESFYCLLYFVYHGALPKERTWDLSSYYELRQIADKYLVKPLKEMADHQINVEASNWVVTQSNLAATLQIASTLSHPVLMRKCADFALKSEPNCELLAEQVNTTETLSQLLKTISKFQPPPPK